jgi:hypothetical protein
LEQPPRLCERTIKALDVNPVLRLIASERWNDGDVRLYHYVDSR